jgi:hypothetical protein
MHIPPELSHYIRDALKAGRSKDDIRAVLRTADWTETEVNAALAGWMTQDTAGAVPRPIRSTAARDALFHALLFVVFGMVVGNTLTLLFAQINIRLPEPDEAENYGQLARLRWSMAALIVFVPVFWLLNRADRRATASDPARKHGLMRRWLSAIALLVAAITLLGDALYLIYSWLDGQITLRFLVKSVTVAVMALIVLAYFREDDGQASLKTVMPAAGGLIGLALLSLGLSFLAVGGPAQGQMEQRDRWRLSDLRILTNDVAQCTGIDRTNLPETLDPMTCARNPARLTGYASQVVYERLSETEFSLCTEIEFPPAISDGTLRVDGTTACAQRRTD